MFNLGMFGYGFSEMVMSGIVLLIIVALFVTRRSAIHVPRGRPSYCRK